jgi:metal-dependent amidase/aminoacylase/carboxypeptidase family protein
MINKIQNNVSNNEFYANRMTVRYTGKAAHAAASPLEGLNALDAAT